MSKTITFYIDGKQVQAEDGMNILDAALANDIYIPHLCHHPDLEPVGGCRLCGVEVDGGQMSMSCMTPVKEGIHVATDSPAIHQARTAVMEMLLATHHMDCLNCKAATDCELLKITNYLGMDSNAMVDLRPQTDLLPVDDSNPFFTFDPNKCVVCGICVRTCNEIVGLGAINLVDRGYPTLIGTFGNQPFADSVCESCGECVVRCPVGALSPKKTTLPAFEVESTCVYCGVGCGIHLGVKGDQIVSVRANKDAPANQGSLCVKGRYGFNFINHPDRLTTPLIKKDGEFVEASWEEALSLVAEKFAQSKGEKFAAFASAKCTNEDNYVIQKFTRAVMGTNSVDHCARL
jgi:formate dehydrogenase major subunit